MRAAPGVRFAAVESEGEIARFSGERAQAGLGLDDEGDVRLGGGDAQPRALGALCIDLAGEALALGERAGYAFGLGLVFIDRAKHEKAVLCFQHIARAPRGV